MIPFIWTPLDPLIFLTFGLALWAQFRVRGTYNKWSQVEASSGLTGYEAARRLLDRHGLFDVPVEPVQGQLTDHYDPIKRVVRLSESVFYERSIAAVSVACHEVGHAIQHAQRYPMLVLRHRMFPVVNLASGVAPFLFLIGILLQAADLILLGIIFFAAAVAFQLVTLPVEFNASARARQLMTAEGFITRAEEAGVAKVLNAAALTYVAATLMAVLELLRFVWIFTQSRE
ncbi:MAG TPA: zinc metallopeptidase [Paenibacillaceae bacterium]